MPARCKPRPWTPAEDAILRRMEGERKTCEEIACELGRTKLAVHNRRFKTGVIRFRRQPQSRRERVAELLSQKPGVTDAQIAREVGCTRNAIARLRRLLGYASLSRREWNAAASATRRENFSKRNGKLTRRQSEIIAALDAGPLTAQELARRTGIHEIFVYKLVQELRQKGRAFAEGHSSRGKGKGKGHCGTTWYSLNWWLANNEGLILKLASRVYAKAANARFDFEDIASEMRVAIARCVKSMKTNGLKFSTYAGKAAYYAGIEWCVKQGNRGVHVPVNKLYERGATPCVTGIEDIAPTDEDRAWEPAAREEESPPTAPDFWARVTDALPKQLAELVVGRFRDGKQLAELSKELLGGQSKQWANELIARGVEQLRASGAFADFAPDSAA